MLANTYRVLTVYPPLHPPLLPPALLSWTNGLIQLGMMTGYMEYTPSPHKVHGKSVANKVLKTFKN